MIRPLLTSTILERAGVLHGFTTRHADPALLPDLHQVTQVHGATVVMAEGDPRTMMSREADAIIGESGRAVAVRTADCVPVLVADPESGRVAAIHAGWRGVEAGVIAAALRHFERAFRNSGRGVRGAYSPSGEGQLLAAIGPCIGPCCFEVGSDVGERIARASIPGAIARRAGDKAFVDLRMAVRAQLCAAGLNDDAIDDVPSRTPEGCTRCNAELFHSYRRDGAKSGRLLAWIVSREARSDRREALP